jgi:hypothetical protein
MNKSKKAGFLAILIAATVFYACTKNNDGTIYSITNAPMTAAQVVPSSGATAAGSIDGSYDTKTHLFTYTLSWIGLSGNPTSIHIHGLGDAGANAIPSSAGGPFVNGIIQTIPNVAAISGSTSGTLYIDNTVLREDDLLAGKYYVDIHTAAKPNGEIRGQIVLKP